MTASTGAYRAANEASAAHPEEFWMDASKAVDWITPPTSAGAFLR